MYVPYPVAGHGPHGHGGEGYGGPHGHKHHGHEGYGGPEGYGGHKHHGPKPEGYGGEGYGGKPEKSDGPVEDPTEELVEAEEALEDAPEVTTATSEDEGKEE